MITSECKLENAIITNELVYELFKPTYTEELFFKELESKSKLLQCVFILATNMAAVGYEIDINVLYDKEYIFINKLN